MLHPLEAQLAEVDSQLMHVIVVEEEAAGEVLANQEGLLAPEVPSLEELDRIPCQPEDGEELHEGLPRNVDRAVPHLLAVDTRAYLHLGVRLEGRPLLLELLLFHIQGKELRDLTGARRVLLRIVAKHVLVVGEDGAHSRAETRNLWGLLK